MLGLDSIKHGPCVAFALFAAVVQMGCSQRPTLEISQKFQQAEELFADAETPEHYQHAAATYQELFDAGFNSGVVHYNQGNAWMQAGQTGRAIAAYRQAKRQLPRDPYLTANLNKAIQRSGQSSDENVPLLNHVFFWQQRLSYGEKLVVFTVLLTLVLILAALMPFERPQAIARRLVLIGLIPLLLLGISIGRDWSAYENTTHGVAVKEVVARKGGSASYDPAFKKPLRDGTEFVLLNRQSDWLQIQVSDTAVGWIPARTAVTY